MNKIAVFGFGGRCINLLLELYNLNLNLKIVAIYDCFYNEVMAAIPKDKIERINHFIKDCKIYTNEEMVYLENEFDLSFISSRNDQHDHSLLLALKYNKHIFCEKPIVNHLDKLLMIQNQFINNTKFFQTGLTLRYSKMVDIVLKHLYKIGQLISVYGKEFVNIGHAVHIMTSWRRDKILSGGLGLEKIVHDYDLLLYFIEKGFNIPINNITISGTDSKTFWTKENESTILNTIRSDQKLSDCYHKWESRIYQPLVSSPFQDLDHESIIPDYQKVHMYFEEDNIHLNFEVSIEGYRTKTERQYEFKGTDGKITIDVIQSIMTVELTNERYEIDLEGDGSSHSGGDQYVMQTLIELMTTNNKIKMPSFNEAIRSTHIGLLCEKAITDNKTYLFKEC